jgi:ribonuclease D
VSAPKVAIVDRDEALGPIAERCARAEAVAVDVEANGLHAFRPRLCTVQLAWSEQGEIAIAIVDALATPLGALAGVLGERGPVKVLHDLTFDARMLAEVGAPLARVRDTSVAARLLGFKATGLAAVAESELGVVLHKRFQQHDWSRRPLGEEHLAYLAGDVAHLLAIDARLADKARERDVEDEIADECAYKLATAFAPPRDGRPAYVRIKGAQALDPTGRAILRRLTLARDAIAGDADVPAFKIVGSDALLELARQRPSSDAAIRALRGPQLGGVARHAKAFAAAVRLGLEDGDVPEEDRAHFVRARVDRAAIAVRRAREAQVTAWRREEARARGVDEQVVLPGHCAQDLVQLLITHDAADPALPAHIAAIAGMGSRRLARYGEALAALARSPAPAPDDATAEPERASEPEAGGGVGHARG